ncbi:unnamed protein product, partial [Ectocarpus sp. 13 AM-2016]
FFNRSSRLELLEEQPVVHVNYHEFYGFDVRDGCPGKERDPDYLANTILIAVAAAIMVPEIRAERTKSPYMSLPQLIEADNTETNIT